MQILHPFEGSVQAYAQQLGEADRYRPAGCPLCGAKKPLIAHGFYGRSVVAEGFDGWIRVRRYLCRLCQRPLVSGLPGWLRATGLDGESATPSPVALRSIQGRQKIIPGTISVSRSTEYSGLRPGLRTRITR